MEEIWKEIPNYGGKYQLSDKGRVKSTVYGYDKILKLSKGCSKSHPYLCCKLYYDTQKCKMFYLHRGLAELFISPYKKGMVVNHIDGNTLNNDLSNLEWVTYSYNVKDGWNRGRIYFKKRSTGVRAMGHKFTNVTPSHHNIRFLLSHGYSQQEVMKMLGVSQTLVSLVKTNKRL